MKIKCTILIYDNIEIIKRSLTSIMKYSDQMEIHVVENPSKYTEFYIKPVMLNLLNKGLITSYTLFDENIRHNAMYSFYRVNPVDIWNCDYLLRTDGDVVGEGDWLEHQLNVLKKYPDVFCCSVEICQDGWSEGLKKIFPKPRSKKSDFIQIDTGIWLCLFRTSEFKLVYDLFTENMLRTRDGPLIRFVSEYLNKKWGVTPLAKAYELTRMGYATPDYLSEKSKLIVKSGGNHNFWTQANYCGFTHYCLDGELYYPSISPEEPRSEKEDPSTDWVASKLRQGIISSETLYFSVNIKNILRGKTFLGSSDTRSFIDKNTDTIFLRCNFKKYRLLPNLESVFKNIVLFDTFHDYEESYWQEIIKFCYASLKSGGSVRLTIRDDHEELLVKITEVFELVGFKKLEKCLVDYSVDLPGEKRYVNRSIFKSEKL